ncbi:eCIS core domain-containing protein [uncultured Aquimarina sp.]|uniref:eCIS core domain-containing protein n=1 Tax=uncultured Aquimarina sp. TaxID=575652 RepID=UPI00260DB20D|nr:DUF4157 domain-containing protein [uncultured Aquimarina sp.]
MKEPQENTQEPQQETVQRVQQELSTGGEAKIVDNRPAVAIQRKLRSAIGGVDNGDNPIQRKANRTGLPDNLKSGIENLSGYSMDDVKVHYNSSKPAQLQAHAYAQGTDIHLAPGQEKHLPHEAWHVVQQKQERVRPTRQLKSKVNINDDVGLEKEADVMGAKALKFYEKKEHNGSLVLSPNVNKPIIQKRCYKRKSISYFLEDVRRQNEYFQYFDNKTEFKNALILIFDDVFENDEAKMSLLQQTFLAEELWKNYGDSDEKNIDLVLLKQICRDFKKAHENLINTRHFKKDYHINLFKFINEGLDVQHYEKRSKNNNIGKNAQDYIEKVGFYEGHQNDSVQNPDSDTLVLGKYITENNVPTDECYLKIAQDNNSMYFDMGNTWGDLVSDRSLDLNDERLFDLFNTRVLDKAVENEADIFFSHDPLKYPNSALAKEWRYLEFVHGYIGLIKWHNKRLLFQAVKRT